MKCFDCDREACASLLNYSAGIYQGMPSQTFYVCKDHFIDRTNWRQEE